MNLPNKPVYHVGTASTFALLMLGNATIAARDERQPNARANLQAIADKLNSYDELVSALRRIEIRSQDASNGGIHSVTEARQWVRQFREIARSALANAKEPS